MNESVCIVFWLLRLLPPYPGFGPKVSFYGENTKMLYIRNGVLVRLQYEHLVLHTHAGKFFSSYPFTEEQ